MKTSVAIALLDMMGFATIAGRGAIAHDADTGPNGGQVVEAKGHHVEFTSKDSTITVYLSDSTHAAITIKGASGRAVILDGSRQSTVTLTSAEPNLLTAKLEAPLTAGARVVISAKLGDGHDVLARFVVK